MDFTPKRKRFAWKETETVQSKYNHDLQMYKDPPEDNISFEEFQQIAVERLKVLQLVENIGGQCLASPEECLQALQKALKKEGYFQFAKLITKKGCASQTEEDIEARRRDNYSHFTLRLAFGMKDDSRAWFIIHETELFKWRFSALNKEGVIKLLSIYDFDFKPISTEEKTELMDKLNNSSYKDIDVCNLDYYKLPYTDVLDLIHDRKVFVQKGMAYVPQTDLISVFVTAFKKSLSADLLNVPKYISNIRHDERLMNFLKSLPECFNGMARVIWNSETTPITMLPELSKSSYPLCMRVMHEQLIANSHLRNGGRLAYGLFLKGIGVTLEDSLIFWKDIFSKGKERDTFDKQHKYTFRHLYGQEGKKCNYTPFGCTKIINSAVGVGEYHGCPYRYMDSQALKNRLNEYSLPLPQVNEIVDLAKKGEYLNACKLYFETTHGCPPEKVTIHPNAYFMESRAIHNGLKNSDSSQSQTTQTTIKSEKNLSSPALTPKTERKPQAKTPKAQTKTPIVKKKLDIEKLLNDDDDMDTFDDLDILN